MLLHKLCVGNNVYVAASFDLVARATLELYCTVELIGSESSLSE